MDLKVWTLYSDLVYVPNEKLEIPGLDKDSGVEFITIKPIN